MEAYVLDQNFQSVGIIDRFESFIWTERYYEYGDFELYMPMEVADLSILQQGNYLWKLDSDRLMIIEKIKITFDAEAGSHLTITGRSAESLLTRRIVWKQTRLRTNLQTAMLKLVEDSIVNPELPQRKMPEIVTTPYSGNAPFTSITIDKTWSGTEIYAAISEQCKLYSVGFKMVLNEKFNKLSFGLYSGDDRSYSQTHFPYVIFSPRFDNLVNTDYISNNEKLKNVALVAGEDAKLGTGRKQIILGNDISGIERRELYVDARDLQSELDEGEAMSDAEYEALLRNRGFEKLSECKYEEAFTGEAETQKSFKYGVDFFMGDVVEIEDSYGHQTTARVTEYITSQDESGFSAYPTFEVVTDITSILG